MTEPNLVNVGMYTPPEIFQMQMEFILVLMPDGSPNQYKFIHPTTILQLNQPLYKNKETNMKTKNKQNKKPAASKVKKPVKKVAKKSTKPTKKKAVKINKKDNETGAKIVDLLKSTLSPVPKTETPAQVHTAPKASTIGTLSPATIKPVNRFSAVPVAKNRFVAAGVTPRATPHTSFVASH